LNRDKKKGKGTERIGRSDGIGATCDVFLQIEEKEEEDDDNPIFDLDDTMTIFVGKCRDGEANRSFKVYKNFANMVIKNKDIYQPKPVQELESLNEIEESDLRSPQESAEDRTMQQDGDFISSD